MSQGDGDERRIYRHAGSADHRPDREFELAHGDEATIAAIERHVEEHLGPIETVHHELVSDLVHLDIHVVPATDDRRYTALVTSGMSDRPMTLPEDLVGELSPYAELVLLLPPDWPVDHGSWSEERHYWPVRWLKILARFPHEHQTWLWASHTLPNGDPPEPLTDDLPFIGVMLTPPVEPPPAFRELVTDDGRTITFFSFVPLHQDEMDLKVARGADPLFDAFDRAGVTELLDVGRTSAVAGASKRRRGLFRRR